MKVSFHRNPNTEFTRKPKCQRYKRITVYAWGYWMLVIWKEKSLKKQ